MAQRAVLACALAATLWGCSPYGGGEFACTLDSQCTPNGTCSDGFCAFPDPSCESGLRFGDLSGPSSGQCVGAQQPPDGGGRDMGDTGGGDNCWGTGLVEACFSGPLTTPVMIGAGTINTDSDSRCATTTNSVPACVIGGQTITIATGAVVGVTGSKPLVLVGAQTITINGTLAASSSTALGFVGAGVDMPGCDAGTAPVGESGGAGGSFGGMGGNGAAVGTAGIAGAPLNMTSLRGGCSGQPGADDTAPIDPGERGRGGGALYLIADTSITVAGVVTASGGGGGGGGPSAAGGGGGGGSGGFLGFDSPSVMNTGSIFANGGAGGEGSGNMSTGNPGQSSTLATAAAIGGNAGSNFGTDGGNGSVGGTLNGSAAAAMCTGPCTTPAAGGGGGGGAGIIKKYRAPSIPGTVSPGAT